MVLDSQIALVAAVAGQQAHNPPGGSAVPGRPGSHVEDWSVDETVGFLKGKGFVSYANYFAEKEYNGMVLLAAEESDINEMPERDRLKRKAFVKFLADLKP
jgi:hypothetical protein